MLAVVKYSFPPLIFLKSQYTDHPTARESRMYLHEWQLPTFGHSIRQTVFLTCLPHKAENTPF